MDARRLTANFRDSFDQNVFRIVAADQFVYERSNVQAVVRIGRLDFIAIEKRQEGELIVRHIEVSFKQGIVIDEPTFMTCLFAAPISQSSTPRSRRREELSSSRSRIK
jgi:hypothetical protein